MADFLHLSRLKFRSVLIALALCAVAPVCNGIGARTPVDEGSSGLDIVTVFADEEAGDGDGEKAAVVVSAYSASVEEQAASSRGLAAAPSVPPRDGVRFLPVRARPTPSATFLLSPPKTGPPAA